MPDVMKTVGRYEILRELGRGGMALVYLARQTDLDRFVALKELGAFHASDASFAQRFLRESRVAGSLSHPNIVTVHDYFEHEGTPYIAMEYVERGSLRPYVGKMTLAQIGGVLEGLLAGLTNAEQNGIVHRDLKPENLMVTSDGRVKIADFGIAKATTKMQTGAFLTATGTTVGTPTYMAPEQAMAQDIGPWTDLYSVGCMAFEMFTGKVPFHDSDAPMAILLRHVNEPIAPVKSIDPQIDQGISDWVESMLVKDPTKRTQSAAEAWDDFEEIIIGLQGPRWRRAARLSQVAGSTDTPNPLTPAPFQGTTAGAAASDEFQSFAWGQPAADTDGSAASTPYTPPPQDLPAGPMEETPAPEAPPAPAEAPAASAAPEAPPAPSDEPIADSGFVTFGAPAPPPPTDALVPPPAQAPPAEPAAPEPVAPEPEVVAPEPEPEPVPEPQAEVAEETTQDGGFETYIAPPPSRPPTEDPGTEALKGLEPEAPAPAPPAPEPVAPPEPEPVAQAPAPPPPVPEPVAESVAPPAPPEPPTEPLAPEPPKEPAAPDPAAVAAYEADPNATVMPEALRRKPEPAAKPKKERKPKERKPREPKAAKPVAPPKPKPEPKPSRPGEKPASKAFPIALAAGAVIAILLGFLVGGSGGGGTEEPAPSAELTGSAASSGAAVKVPSDWKELGAAPDVPGLSLSDPKAAAPGGKDGGLAVVVGSVEKAADNSTLLAQPFMQAVGEVPKPNGAVQIGGGDVQAYRYNALELNGFDRAVTVYAAPTTAGVATVACLAPKADADSFASTCDQIANTLTLSAGKPFPLGPSEKYAGALNKTLGALGKADKSGQAKLKAAKTPQQQAAAAKSLAKAFHGAGRTLARQSLSPADRTANAQLVSALRQTGGGYDKAAAAASKNSKPAFSKAGGDVAKGRKAIATALGKMKNAGYDVAS